jgi:alpha-ketoglutarate-dependent taurine dioxygenase
VVVEQDGVGTLSGWIDANKEVVDGHLNTAGAVLFRGFPAPNIAGFGQVARQVCGELIRENPEHTAVSADGSVQTPVAYAAERMLLWHNENSFNEEWPMRIAFCCFRPAEKGGETPIVDSCLVYRSIDSEIRAKFIERGIAYIRQFGSGVGLDWRTIFRTSDRQAAAQYCDSHRIVAEWSGTELVRTIAIRPAVISHPRTGELSWFNQAQHWHPACLDPDVREIVENHIARDGTPRHCTFGDGTPIPDSDMQHILGVYQQNQILFPWRAGDVLVLDNVMWAHGRAAYQGRRTMLVALGSGFGYSAGRLS